MSDARCRCSVRRTGTGVHAVWCEARPDGPAVPAPALPVESDLLDDVDEHLVQLRAESRKCHRLHVTSVRDLCDLVDQLDRHLRAGGSIPEDWKH